MRVAVIDTGVSPHPEIAHLRPGRDFVAADALQDCDNHGTAVAGIIAGRTLGIAPEAEILSVRQTSAHYRDAEAGNLETLTDAIHNALDEGAGVLNISVVSCLEPAFASRIDASGITAALARAEAQGAVVVAAAGNTGPDCQPGYEVFPARFPTVLAVAARADNHTIAPYSLVAELSAPGVVPAALAPGGWAEGTLGKDGVRPYAGTSFATPVVSGTAALLQSRYPGISPSHVRALITASAQPGGGAVDPLAALTQLSPQEIEPRPPLRVRAVDGDTNPAVSRLGLLGGSALVLVALIATLSSGLSTWRSGRRRESAPRPPAARR
ncbi:S8 family serine peptidase [Corynebacterium sp. zg-915]|uniref:S8 family serine peptidase n=1 Tax=Corynebacterium wankanglinii TaxID=2735136 RepID=A0A838CHJ4_9CORY|nr:S8 family serine peptidase [Corynebacterium wankanglinii]